MVSILLGLGLKMGWYVLIFNVICTAISFFGCLSAESLRQNQQLWWTDKAKEEARYLAKWVWWLFWCTLISGPVGVLLIVLKLSEKTVFFLFPQWKWY